MPVLTLDETGATTLSSVPFAPEHIMGEPAVLARLAARTFGMSPSAEALLCAELAKRGALVSGADVAACINDLTLSTVPLTPTTA